MRRLAPLLLAVGLLATAACTDDDDEDTVTAGSEPTTTTSEPATTTTAAGGTTTTFVEGSDALEPLDLSQIASDPNWQSRPDNPAAVQEFNQYVADGPQPYADSALDLAAVFLGLANAEEGVRVEAAVEGNRVTIVENNLPDDSLAAQLTVLVFEPSGDILQLADVSREVSCRPGRGHEDFSTEPCV